MKNVLMIAYSFPPAGGPGVQRTSKFVKFLHGYGWEPLILTRDDRNMPLRDDSLIKDIPENTKIVRTKAWNLASGDGPIGLMGKFINKKFLIPDSERLWEIFSRRKAKNLIKHHNIRMIYTTSLPYSSHLMAIHLKKYYPEIPWVADFRDEWTNNPYILDNPYNPIRMNIERRMEKRVLQMADCLITNTPVMLENFLENYKNISRLRDKFFVIPNGFDPQDFKNILPSFSNNENSRKEEQVFTITYTGSFYGRRKPDLFFNALGNLVSENKINKDKIGVRLIGNFNNNQIKQALKKYSIEGIVKILPYMEHNQCIQNMVNSHCLLLIEGAGPGAEAFYTGKIFEYMIAGRPILAIIPKNGAAAQLIRKTNTGFVSDCLDLDKTKENIIILYNSWEKNTNVYYPNKDEIKKYERNTLTKELAKVFDKALLMKSH